MHVRGCNSSPAEQHIISRQTKPVCWRQPGVARSPAYRVRRVGGRRRLPSYRPARPGVAGGTRKTLAKRKEYGEKELKYQATQSQPKHDINSPKECPLRVSTIQRASQEGRRIRAEAAHVEGILNLTTQASQQAVSGSSGNRLEAQPPPPADAGPRPACAFWGMRGSGHWQLSAAVRDASQPRSRSAPRPRTRPAALLVLPDPKGRCRRRRTQGRLLRAGAGEPPLDVCFPVASSEAETREPGISQPGRCQRAPANHLRPGTSSRLPGLSAQRGTWKSIRRKDGFQTRGFIIATQVLQINPRRAAEQERSCARSVPAC